MIDDKLAEKLLEMMDKKFDEILKSIQKESENSPTGNDIAPVLTNAQEKSNIAPMLQEKTDYFEEIHRIFKSVNDTLDKIDKNNIEICATHDRIIAIDKKLKLLQQEKEHNLSSDLSDTDILL